MKFDKFVNGNGETYFAMQGEKTADGKQKYIDLKNRSHQWTSDQQYFVDCLAADIKALKAVIFNFVETIEN